MFCTKCGSPNPDDAPFCQHCSAPLARPSGQEAGPPPPPGDRGASPGGYAQAGQQAPPGYQPYQGYQGPALPYTPPMPESASGRAIAALILGILGLVMCGPFTGVPALIIGKMEMTAIREGQSPRAGETLAKVGFYLGIIGTVLSCLLGSIWAVLAFMGILSSGFNS